MDIIQIILIALNVISHVQNVLQPINVLLAQMDFPSIYLHVNNYVKTIYLQTKSTENVNQYVQLINIIMSHLESSFVYWNVQNLHIIVVNFVLISAHLEHIAILIMYVIYAPAVVLSVRIKIHALLVSLD